MQELSAKGDGFEWIERRPPAFNHVLMFKVLLLQAMHTLSDEPDERRKYLIKDRLSLLRFLGLGLADAVTGREYDLDLP